MQQRSGSTRWRILAGLAAVAILGGTRLALGSDHQDTPDRGGQSQAGHDRRVRVSQPDRGPDRAGDGLPRLPHPAGAASDPSFDPDLLYQFKIDNDGDAKEDQVIQVTFSGSGASQQVEVRGPVAPPVRGPMANEVADVTPAVSGRVDTTLGSAIRDSGVRRPAGRSLLHRSRGGVLHPARPEARGRARCRSPAR